MGKPLYLLSAVLEILGVAVGSAGLTIELLYRADFGFVLITGGSLFVAAGGLLFAKALPRRR